MIQVCASFAESIAAPVSFFRVARLSMYSAASVAARTISGM